MFHLWSMLIRCGICTAKVNQGEFNSSKQHFVNDPRGSLGSNIEITYSREKKKPIYRPLKYKVRAFLSSAGCLNTGHMFIFTGINCFHFPSTSVWVNYFHSKLCCRLYSEYSHRTFLTVWHTPESDCNGLSWVCPHLRFSNWQPHTVCAKAQQCVCSKQCSADRFIVSIIILHSELLTFI